MADNIFYDGTKLLSLKDLDGNLPEIYICTSNRSAGKTTYFSRYLVNRFKKHGEKFCLLYRFVYELSNVSEKFFKDIQKLFFPNDNMSQSFMDSTTGFCQLELNDVPCGYAVALNSADALKKNSHLLSDTKRIFFDEFQSEIGHYCNKEIEKFISIHTSIARGGGEQVRYCPVIMCSNTVSLLNPYYNEMDVAVRLKSDTKFLRGHGYVLEQGFNPHASESQLSSGFNKAFCENRYTAYSAQGVYLNDSLAFIETPTGYSQYVATIILDGKNYAVRDFPNDGIMYVNTTIDKTCPIKIAVNPNDHRINYVLLSGNSYLLDVFRKFFETGNFRFKNLKCKEVLMRILAYSMR